jgi:dienelactone hydrolase
VPVLLALLACGLLLVGGCSAKLPQRIDRAAVAGPSPAAGAAANPAAGDAGTGVAPAKAFPVGMRTFTFTETPDRVLRTTVWFPAGGPGGSRVGVAAGRFPVVVFSHGLLGLPNDYRDLLTRWAAAGFVVVAPAYPHTSRGAAAFEVIDMVHQPTDASFVLTRVLALDAAAGDPFAGHLDAEHLAAAGHSGGAITTVGLFASGRDARLDAGIVLAGNALGMGSSYLGPPAALLFVHGDGDPVTPYGLGHAAYEAVPGGWSKAFLTLTGQGHTDPYLHASAPAFRTVAATTIDFLRWTLYRDPGAKQRLAVDPSGRAGMENRL